MAMSEEINVKVVRPSTWHREAKTWCHNNVGTDWWASDEGDWTWVSFGSSKDGSDGEVVIYSFRKDSDALEFALRWQ
jgi:hypothetical protein